MNAQSDRPCHKVCAERAAAGNPADTEAGALPLAPVFDLVTGRRAA